VESTISSGGSNLSAGERQCVVLARACLSSASALILDEITAHMDAACSRLCLSIVKRELCGRGKAVLFISHRPDDLKMCDEVLLMRGGCVVLRSSPEEAALALADQEEP
jgi:ATP-binding cassette subfamily C (CFTR/MRP) protein 5